MPIVVVKMLEGRTVKQKRTLVQSITNALVETLACRPENVHVLLEDIKPMNWGTGGKLPDEENGLE